MENRHNVVPVLVCGTVVIGAWIFSGHIFRLLLDVAGVFTFLVGAGALIAFISWISHVLDERDCRPPEVKPYAPPKRRKRKKRKLTEEEIKCPWLRVVDRDDDA